MALFQRYYAGQARNLVEGHLRRGKGQPDANRPSVRIISIKVSSTEDCAELRTVESWFLTRGGKVVFRETNKKHTVFLEKSPTLGGRWVVTRII
ncbi:MAG: hypothetical protein HYW00_01540 [Candidatus Colwellbacteria bacterium]|nr:hypothetical protein [Candidatus Colwellbacteria bacterium]